MMRFKHMLPLAAYRSALTACLRSAEYFDEDLSADLIRQAAKLRTDLTDQGLSNILLACARLAYPGRLELQPLAAEAHRRLKDYNHTWKLQEIINTLWALCMLQVSQCGF